MATVKTVSAQEQNINTLAGVQIDTALIGSAGVVYTMGRNPPVVVIAGTQTSSLAPVILDLYNARIGDVFTIKKYTTSVLGTGASQINIVSGSAAGAVIGAIQTGTACPNMVIAAFDGVAWR